jgi:hypothetical protein
MGASIVRGKRFEKRPYATTSGAESSEIVPVEGAYESASYTTVAEMVRLCQSLGVARGAWPIYYGTWQGDISLEDVRARCDSLRTLLPSVVNQVTGSNWLLDAVCQWLRDGEDFAIWE